MIVVMFDVDGVVLDFLNGLNIYPHKLEFTRRQMSEVGMS
jgi:hypothetical protein